MYLVARNFAPGVELPIALARARARASERASEAPPFSSARQRKVQRRTERDATTALAKRYGENKRRALYIVERRGVERDEEGVCACSTR